jgi:hypothetical protein
MQKAIGAFTILVSTLFIVAQFAFMKIGSTGIFCPLIGKTNIKTTGKLSYPLVIYGFPLPAVEVSIDVCSLARSAAFKWSPIGLGVDSLLLIMLTAPFWMGGLRKILPNRKSERKSSREFKPDPIEISALRSNENPDDYIGTNRDALRTRTHKHHRSSVWHRLKRLFIPMAATKVQTRKAVIAFSILISITFILAQIIFVRTSSGGDWCSPYLGAPQSKGHSSYQAVDYGFPIRIMTVVNESCFTSATTTYKWNMPGMAVDVLLLIIIAYPLWSGFVKPTDQE